MKQHAHNRCRCGHVRRLHDKYGCLSVNCWSPLERPEVARCKRFRLAKPAQRGDGEGR